MPKTAFAMRTGVALCAMVCLNPPPCRQAPTQDDRVKTRGRRGIRGNSIQEEKKQNKKNISSGNDSAAPSGEVLERSGELGRTIFSPSRLLPVALKCSATGEHRAHFE
jgi:hypothetical protein